MRPHTTTICLFAVMLPTCTSATTIICADTALDSRAWVEKYFGLADAVLLGTVTSMAPPDLETYRRKKEEQKARMDEVETLQEKYELLGSLGGKPTDYSEWPYASVTFEVVKRWKGPELREFSAKQDVFPGGGGLHIGQTYLVFAYKQQEGIYTVSTACRSTMDAASAEERIEILDEIVEDGRK